MDPKIYPNGELYRMMDRVHNDPKRVISWHFLAEMTGLSEGHLKDVFVNKKHPLTEMIQIRVSYAMRRIEAGEVQIMQNHDRTRFIQYNKENKPKIVRSNGLRVQNGQIRLKLGLRNANDYSDETFDEQLKRGTKWQS